MAKKYLGTFKVPGGLGIENPLPADDRLVVENDADLLNNSELPNIYEGIIVYSEESKKPYLWNGQDRTNASNWEELGASGGSIYDLQLSGNDLIILEDGSPKTTIDLSPYLDNTDTTYDIELSGTDLILTEDGVTKTTISLSSYVTSADSVTKLNDVTSAGSGKIITSAERAKLNEDFQYTFTTSTDIALTKKRGEQIFADSSGNPRSDITYNLTNIVTGAFEIIRSDTPTEVTINNNANSLPVVVVGFTEFDTDELANKVIDIVIEAKPHRIEVYYRYIADN